MKIIHYPLSILFILCLTTITMKDLEAGEGGKFVLVYKGAHFKKNEEVFIELDNPYTLYKNIRLCFLLDIIKKNGAVKSEDVDNVVKREFGENSATGTNLETPANNFIKGQVSDDNNSAIYRLYGKRFLMTEWKHSEDTLVHYIYACTPINKSPSKIENVKYIKFTPLYNFNAKGTFFYYEK